MSVVLTKFVPLAAIPVDAVVSSGEHCCWGCTLDTRAAACGVHGAMADPQSAREDLLEPLDVWAQEHRSWDDHVTSNYCGHPYGYGCTDRSCAAPVGTFDGYVWTNVRLDVL